jgi:2'-5' RNA ligase
LTRAFVAVSLPDAVLDAVAARAASVAIPGRPTTRDQWHVTLQFLGDRADLDAVAAALTGLEVEGGPARLGGAGAFPRPARASVLWLGFVDGGPVLQRLADAVMQRTDPLGHERETRPFQPHVTLARCRTPTDVRPVVAALGDSPFGPAWTIDTVTVYESKRLRDGARYIPRGRIELPR